jgi:hypothetical protein
MDMGAARGLDVVVTYEFSLCDDGPYTGESYAPSWFGGTGVISISEKLTVGPKVRIRYRPDRPSLNTLDRSVWKDLEGGL